MSEHLTDYKSDLLAKGNTHQHANETHALAANVVERGKVGRISELTPARVQGAIKSIRDAGRSLRTCNKALQSIKSFSRWLVRDHRAPGDALAHLKGYNADTDRRVQRRALSDDELAHLVEAAEHGAIVMGLTGRDRAMAYRLATGSGFRVSELRSLTSASFDLDADLPTVTVEAGYSKRRRHDVQPIRPDLAVHLRSWLDTKPDSGSVLPLPHRHTADMMRADLMAARKTWLSEAASDAERQEREQSDMLRYVDDAGRVADFHSLRHTFITRLVNSGATVKVAQELARHSTPTLTIGRYAHARLHDLSAALDALPDTKAPVTTQPLCGQQGPTTALQTPRNNDSRFDSSQSAKRCNSARRRATCVTYKAPFKPTTATIRNPCNVRS